MHQYTSEPRAKLITWCFRSGLAYLIETADIFPVLQGFALLFGMELFLGVAVTGGVFLFSLFSDIGGGWRGGVSEDGVDLPDVAE